MARTYQPKTKRGSIDYEPFDPQDLNLEDILAEFGESRAQQLLSKVEQEASTLVPATVQFTSPEKTPFAPPDPPSVEMVQDVDESTFGEAPPPPPKLNLAPVDEFGAPSEPEEDYLRAAAPYPAQKAYKPKRVVQFPVKKPAPEPEKPDPVTDYPLKQPVLEKVSKKDASAEQMVGSTVDQVLEETQGAEPIVQRRKRGLFSRKLQEETEQLYDSMDDGATTYIEPPPPPPEIIEPDCAEEAIAWRKRYNKAMAALPGATFVSLFLPVILILTAYGIEIPFWDDPTIVLAVTAAWIGLMLITCRQVAVHGLYQMSKRCLSVESLLWLGALASLSDCVISYTHGDLRGDAPLYAVVSGISLLVGLWGVKFQCQGQYEMFRVVALDNTPPHLITETADGASKQDGGIKGFYTLSNRGNLAHLTQGVIMPLVLSGSLVFATLCSFGQDKPWAFAMALSAILGGGGCAALSIAWGLPWAGVATQLQKNGCAVAGYLGAKRISRQRTMVVTDEDLFPPSTLELNGYKLFGIELRRAASYAASVTKAAQTGQFTLFDRLRRNEAGKLLTVENFQFRKEGGYACNISGETVLLGTANFMNKMDVRLPNGLNLNTGVFLAIDGSLVAVFAVKYQPAERVDYALRIMRHNRVLPVLAVRDPNITPTLIHRKFNNRMRLTYPPLPERVALSETGQEEGVPQGVVSRNGLLPYAAAVVGGRRLCSATRYGVLLGTLGSLCGAMLCFYLVFLEAFTLLTPLALLAFALAWTLPVFLGGLSAKHL